MKKTEKPKQEQKPRAPAKRKGVVELTDTDLERVQGGRDPATGLPSGKRQH